MGARINVVRPVSGLYAPGVRHVVVITDLEATKGLSMRCQQKLEKKDAKLDG